MAGGFFKNVGGDIRQIVEGSFLEGYKHKFKFFEEDFEYTYTRTNGITGSQIYTYNSLIKELQKRNINITDVNMVPAQDAPIFGILRFTCLFKNGGDPIIIQVVPRNLESIIDDYSRK